MGEKRAKNFPDPADKLRIRAEAIAWDKAVRAKELRSAPSPEAALELIHELEVHQIELEMQNDELSRTGAELEESTSRYFSLYDMAPVGYFSLNKSGAILEANLTAAGLLGVSRQALVNRPVARFIVPEDQRSFSGHLTQFFEAGTPQTFRMQMLRADAAPFWVQVSASAGLDVAGTHVCHAVISDITELRRAEEDRVRAETRLGQLQKAESLGLMAAAIAHHFTIVIQAVMGNLKLAMADLAPGGKPHENLIEAMRAMNRESVVTGQMLTYVGEVVGKPEELDLSAVCRGSLPVLRAAMLKDLVLKTDFPSPGPIVCASANQIHQVLTILVANAWEAVGESLGVIHLATRTVLAAAVPTAHRFPIGWQPHDIAYACLEVAEQGRGISDEDIGKIFDPYFSSSLTARGLGLPVVLGIVRAHGGAVTVESEPGKGSAFQVFLPLRRCQQTTPSPGGSSSA